MPLRVENPSLRNRCRLLAALNLLATPLVLVYAHEHGCSGYELHWPLVDPLVDTIGGEALHTALRFENPLGRFAGMAPSTATFLGMGGAVMHLHRIRSQPLSPTVRFGAWCTLIYCLCISIAGTRAWTMWILYNT